MSVSCIRGASPLLKTAIQLLQDVDNSLRGEPETFHLSCMKVLFLTCQFTTQAITRNIEPDAFRTMQARRFASCVITSACNDLVSVLDVGFDTRGSEMQWVYDLQQQTVLLRKLYMCR